MHSEGKPVARPVIKQAKFFNEEMKVTNKCIFSDCWLQNLGTV
jgi:hypothetical protein